MKSFLLGIAIVDGLTLAFILGWAVNNIVSGTW